MWQRNMRQWYFSSVQFSSFSQSCRLFCIPMNRSTPGLPVHHQLPEFTQTHVHRVGDAIQPCHPLSSPSPPAPNPSQRQSLFQWVTSSHEVTKVLEFQLQHHSFQFSRSNYEIYERQTQKGERLYWIGHGALEDMKTVSEHIQRLKSSLARQKGPKRCNRQLAENHNACELICHLRTECYDVYKAVGGIGSAYQQLCHAQRTWIRKTC